MVAGFIGIFGFGFLSESNNYTGNGVSFEYPADYKITEVKDNSTALNFSIFNATKISDFGASQSKIVNTTKLEISPAFLIAKNTKNPDLTFQVSKSPVNGSVYHGMGLYEYYNLLSNNFNSRGWFVMLENTTLYMDDEDVKGYEIRYKEKIRPDPDSVNGYIVIFDKNGIRYTIDFKGKGKQYYDSWASIKVATSFKVL